MKTTEKSKKRRIRSGASARKEAEFAIMRDPSAAPHCDPRCERYADCRPDAPGWVSKKQAAANVGTSPSALRQRAARAGYASPSRIAMPRRDQPKLCLDAAYFKQSRRARNRPRG